MIWLTNDPPENWFICDGSSYYSDQYAALTDVLYGMEGYVVGKLPDMRSCYPAQVGNEHMNDLRVAQVCIDFIGDQTRVIQRP